jgi:hypothetical protein
LASAAAAPWSVPSISIVTGCHADRALNSTLAAASVYSVFSLVSITT